MCCLMRPTQIHSIIKYVAFVFNEFAVTCLQRNANDGATGYSLNSQVFIIMIMPVK